MVMVQSAYLSVLCLAFVLVAVTIVPLNSIDTMVTNSTDPVRMANDSTAPSNESTANNTGTTEAIKYGDQGDEEDPDDDEEEEEEEEEEEGKAGADVNGTSVPGTIQDKPKKGTKEYIDSLWAKLMKCGYDTCFNCFKQECPWCTSKAEHCMKIAGQTIWPLLLSAVERENLPADRKPPRLFKTSQNTLQTNETITTTNPETNRDQTSSSAPNTTSLSGQ